MIESVRNPAIAGEGAIALDPVREAAAARAQLPFTLPGCPILELGCGSGWSSLLLAARAGHGPARVVAWDPDPAALTATRAAVRQAGFEDRVRFVDSLAQLAAAERFAAVRLGHRVTAAPLLAALLAVADRHLAAGGRLWAGFPAERADDVLVRLQAAGFLVSTPDGARGLLAAEDCEPVPAGDLLVRAERVQERTGFEVRVHPDASSLLGAFDIRTPGLLLEPDLDVVENDCERHARKRRDAEVLCGLARGRPGPCLDLGTSHGRSAFKLATNIDSHQVTTVNMLPEHAAASGLHTTHVLAREEIGSYARERGIVNLRQLYANTRDWDWAGVPDRIQLAFVDACHDSEAVLADSLQCWRRLVPGGFLVWHDFSPASSRQHPWIESVMTGMRAFLAGVRPTPVVHHLLGSWCGVIEKEEDHG